MKKASNKIILLICIIIILCIIGILFKIKRNDKSINNISSKESQFNTEVKNNNKINNNKINNNVNININNENVDSSLKNDNYISNENFSNENTAEDSNNDSNKSYEIPNDYIKKFDKNTSYVDGPDITYYIYKDKIITDKNSYYPVGSPSGSTHERTITLYDNLNINENGSDDYYLNLIENNNGKIVFHSKW